MREIKFRGKNSFQNNWFYGFLTKEKNKYYITEDSTDFYQIDENTIGQYTGLKDKNGKEIYEGDLVKFPSGLGGKETCVIYYDEWQNSLNIKNYPRGYIYDGLYNLKNKKEIEVIGNIYDKEE